MSTLITISVIVAIIIIVLWIITLGDLMSRPDEDFIGRFDKLSWSIILTFTGLIGLIAYRVSGPSRSTQIASAAGGSSPEGRIHRADDECLHCGAQIPLHSDKCPECGWSYTGS